WHRIRAARLAELQAIPAEERTAADWAELTRLEKQMKEPAMETLERLAKWIADVDGRKAHVKLDDGMFLVDLICPTAPPFGATDRDDNLNDALVSALEIVEARDAK